MNKIPTAKELLEQIVKSDEWGYNDFYYFAGQTQDISTQLRLIKQLAIEFTKLHVKVALKKALASSKTDSIFRINRSWGRPCTREEGLVLGPGRYEVSNIVKL